MTLVSNDNIKGRPFVKWAGGKTQLLASLDAFLPHDLLCLDRFTYIEPLVGGGAFLFHMLQNYPNLKKAVINDINLNLVKTYLAIKESPFKLIAQLESLQKQYSLLNGHNDKKEFYLTIRQRFNTRTPSDIEQAAYMIFLNRTCFNGLYRENSKGAFNVPFGRYTNPKICDYDLIIKDSRLLQNVTILHGDFSETRRFRDKNTFFYFDPPYRPISATSNFNSYVKEAFDDSEQIRLHNFYAEMSHDGCYNMLSNSDGRYNETISFLETLYNDFFIERVVARRSINANPLKRGPLTELLIRNYKEIKG